MCVYYYIVKIASLTYVSFLIILTVSELQSSIIEMDGLTSSEEC